MILIDSAMRGATVAIFLLWAALLLRDARERIGAAFAVGVASYAICSAPDFNVPTTFDWRVPVLVLCVGNPAMFWLFARRMFEDGFRAKAGHWAAYVAYALIGSAIVVGAQGPFAANRSLLRIALGLGTIGFAVATAWTVWRGHKDDLVEQRRRVRPVMMGGAILYVLAIAAADLGAGGAAPTPELRLLNGAVLAILAFVTALVFLKGPGAELFAPASPPPVVSPPPTSTLSDLTMAKLKALFDGDRVYREPEITLADVARRIGVAEYRLRALINQQMGHRNFATFVNGYRIAEAKAALGDPQQINVPISTIALDAGFGSLGVFNRAFKADTGLTPTAFRKSALEKQIS